MLKNRVTFFIIETVSIRKRRNGAEEMRQYLTIGEVAKIKKISIKSLRYYEQIGILVPVKINSDNGYRYYSREQLLTIDMIKFLRDMDIPLKEWHQYINTETGFHLKELIEDSRKHALEQIADLQLRLQRLEIAARGLLDNEKYESREGYYNRRIPERNMLCYPIKNPISQIEFHKTLSILFERADRYHVSANYPSGILMDYEKGTEKFFTFLEIYENMEGHPDFRCFPEHEYRCIRKEQKSIVRVVKEEPEYFKRYPKATVIEADCIISPVDFRPYPTELQFYYQI